MDEGRNYKFVSSGNVWVRELVLMFAAGLALATLLWFGIWYFQARPAQADAWQAQLTELQDRGARLQACDEGKKRLQKTNAQLEAEVQQLDRQLRQAWLAYGRLNQKAKAEAKP